jgi:hypothetical protein
MIGSKHSHILDMATFATTPFLSISTPDPSLSAIKAASHYLFFFFFFFLSSPNSREQPAEPTTTQISNHLLKTLDSLPTTTMPSKILTFFILLLTATFILATPITVSNHVIAAHPDIANNDASNADGSKVSYSCSDGDTTCANGYTAVAYCDNNGWWVREFCGAEQKCNWEPYPFCVSKDFKGKK